jgi:glutaredoxin 3
MPKIIMYKTPICPYCNMAKNLLKTKGVDIDKIIEIDISKDPKLKSEMMEKTNGAMTVPQIFINDTYVGGCDDLHDLSDKGELDKLLKK